MLLIVSDIRDFFKVAFVESLVSVRHFDEFAQFFNSRFGHVDDLIVLVEVEHGVCFLFLEKNFLLKIALNQIYIIESVVNHNFLIFINVDSVHEIR